MTILELYIDLIRKKIKTIDDVPDLIRSEVEELFEEKSAMGKEDATNDNDK